MLIIISNTSFRQSGRIDSGCCRQSSGVAVSVSACDAGGSIRRLLRSLLVVLALSIAFSAAALCLPGARAFIAGDPGLYAFADESGTSESGDANASDDPGASKKTNDPTGDTEPAVWIGVPTSNKAKVRFLKNAKGQPIEFRTRSKQKMYAYDTFQGAATDGEYAYHILNERVKNRDKIIKIRLKDLAVVKVSKVLNLHHGNDMTYDSANGTLVAIHESGALKRLSVINPKTLKIIKHVNVKIPSKLPGASKSFVSGILGFTGIGYDEEEDNYVLSIKKTRHYIVLDKKFKPVRVIKVPKLAPYTPQGLDVKSGFILRSYSASSKTYNSNIIYIFDLNGNFIKRIDLGKGYEIESIYFVGKKLYAGTYRSYYKKIVKKVKKRVRVRKKVFTGKYNAKGQPIYRYKYRYKKKKVKVKYYALRRDNNIIRITNY